ncbi:MAG: thymidine kinase [Planctomycetota bacterium]|nr:thymidine kinase [Planctomycetota bacterium]
MAKLYFYYSAMNAGKSTTLLQSSYNYHERGMRTLILVPDIDTRDDQETVTSRIGLSAEATTFHLADNVYKMVEQQHQQQPLDCVLVDEAQFLTREQVRQISDVSDQLDIPVLTYGLRTDFQGKLFEGSEQLLAWADNLVEIKTICHCGRKATMVLRIGEDGQVIKQGAQVKIGGNELYVSVCRKHFKTGMAERRTDELVFEEFEPMEESR